MFLKEQSLAKMNKCIVEKNIGGGIGVSHEMLRRLEDHSQQSGERPCSAGLNEFWALHMQDLCSIVLWAISISTEKLLLANLKPHPNILEGTTMQRR